MSFKMNVVYVLVLCGWLSMVVEAADNCRKCINDISCIDEKDYYYCIDGQPDRSEVLTCGDDKICANTGGPCIDALDNSGSPTTDISCPDIGSCKRCSSRYTCVSKTQYARCVNGKVQTPSIACNEGEFCSLQSYKDEHPICVPSCVLNHLKYEPSCSGDTSTQASSNIDYNEECWAALKTGTIQSNTFNLETADCKSYIRCELINWKFISELRSCPEGFYNSEKKECDRNKTGCK